MKKGKKYVDYSVTRRIGVILAGIVLTSALFSPFLLYDTVDTTEYGLKYSTWTSSLIDENVYTGGRHYTGFFGKFLIFPATQQTIDFTAESITGRTSDGLAISLQISFQYQLVKEKIVSIYKSLGVKYEDIFLQTSRDNLRDTTSLYTAIQFFNNRSLIGVTMEESLNTVFKDLYGTNIPAFQLRSIDLPDSFEDALERAEVARQEIEIAKLEQEKALIDAQTKILEAQSQYNVTIIEAKAEADAYLTIIEAQAKAVNITLTAEREAYYALGQSLNLTSSELLAFLWIDALTQIGEYGNLVIIGDNTPFINITPTNTTMVA